MSKSNGDRDQANIRRDFLQRNCGLGEIKPAAGRAEKTGEPAVDAASTALSQNPVSAKATKLKQTIGRD